VHETWPTCNGPGVHADSFELRLGYPSVAEITANDDNDEIIIINYIFQIVQTASEAFSLWEYSSRGLKLTTHLHLVPRLRMKGAIHHSPLHIHVVLIYFYCFIIITIIIIIIIIISTDDKNLNVFSGVCCSLLQPILLP
jgi:hypothetical protein